MEEIDHGTHARCLGKATVRDQEEFRYKHLLRWKKTNTAILVCATENVRESG